MHVTIDHIQRNHDGAIVCDARAEFTAYACASHANFGVTQMPEAANANEPADFTNCLVWGNEEGDTWVFKMQELITAASIVMTHINEWRKAHPLPAE